MRRLQLVLQAGNQALDAKVAERTAELKKALEQVERPEESAAERKQPTCNRKSRSRQVIAISSATSAALKEMLRKVDLVAAADTTVLIHGETGSGKELIARAVHERSPRRERPMVKLNCSAISADSSKANCSGISRARSRAPQTSESDDSKLADGGTLFLDEVSELPLETQTKLLRVLQEGEFEPVGSSKSVKVDVRVIAACNRNLQADVTNGPLSSRSVLSTQRISHRRSRGATARRRYPRAGRILHGALCAQDGEVVEAHRSGHPRKTQSLFVARQHSRSAKRESNARRSFPVAIHSPWTGYLETPAQSCFAVAAAGGNGANTASVAPPAVNGGVLTLEELERQHFISVLKKTHGVIEGKQGAAKILNLTPSTTRFRMKKLWHHARVIRVRFRFCATGNNGPNAHRR